MQLCRLIISRTDSIGDVVLTLPMAAAFKQRYPDVYVMFLGAAYTRDIIECCPFVDEFVDWTAISKLPEQEQVEKFKALNAGAIIHVFPRKAIAKLAKKVGIPIRVGTSHRMCHWRYCNRRVNFSRKKSDLHEAQLNLKLLKPFHMPAMRADLEQVQQMMSLVPAQLDFDAKNQLDKKRFNIILHPKSKGSGREWGIDNFSHLIDLLPKDKYKIFICGVASEREKMGDLLNKVSDDVVDLCGKLSLAEYIAFIASADALIAASTGPVHIAAAVGIHTIGLYPPIRPAHAGRWAPIGPKVKVFSVDKKCNECRHTTFCSCIHSIQPETIYRYLETIR